MDDAPRPEPDPLSLALEGLRAACERHEVAQDRRDLPAAYVSGVEGVWWVCTLDEALGGTEKPPNDYQSARDVDPRGRIVLGLRWLRNQHTHALPLTAAWDHAPFFGSGRGVIALSKGFCWRPSDEIDPTRGHVHRRDAYDAHVAGNNSGSTLMLALRWLMQAQERQVSE